MRHALVMGVVFTLAIAGCEEESKDDSGKDMVLVTFVISADAALFAPDGTISVSIFDQYQMETIANNEKCSYEFDPLTRAESRRCPSGITYEEPVPEVFPVEVASLAGNLRVKSTTVRTTQPFRITASGMSADGCNTTSFVLEGTASTATVNLSPSWATTQMACQ